MGYFGTGAYVLGQTRALKKNAPSAVCFEVPTLPTPETTETLKGSGSSE